MDPDVVAAGLQRALRHLTWATILLYGVVIVLVAVLAWRGAERQDEVDAQVAKNTLVLCAFRADVQHLIDNGLQFDATLAALGSLDCPKPVADRRPAR